jgi:hypothetical protein
MQILNYDLNFYFDYFPKLSPNIKRKKYSDIMFCLLNIHSKALDACIPNIFHLILKFLHVSEIRKRIDLETGDIDHIRSVFFNAFDLFLTELKIINGTDYFCFEPYWLKTKFKNSETKSKFINVLWDLLKDNNVHNQYNFIYDIYSKPIYVHKDNPKRWDLSCVIFIKGINSLIFLPYKNMCTTFIGEKVVYDRDFSPLTYDFKKESACYLFKRDHNTPIEEMVYEKQEDALFTITRNEKIVCQSFEKFLIKDPTTNKEFCFPFFFPINTIDE